MEQFKREDYIYLRFIKNHDEIHAKKGDIIRYRKDQIIEKMKNYRLFNSILSSSSLSLEENPNVKENDIFFHQYYKEITVTKDIKGKLYLGNTNDHPKENKVYVNDWLLAHLYDNNGISIINNKSLSKELKNAQVLYDIPKAFNNIRFTEGEKLDFTNPAVASLFYDNWFMNMLLHTETIEGKEKEKLFQKDFSNAIMVIPAEEYWSPWIDNDEYKDSYKKVEHHYFKIKDDIKIPVENSRDYFKIYDKLGILPGMGKNLGIVKNDKGYLTHICSYPSLGEDSSRYVEQRILKIANRISVEEAKEVHKQACLNVRKEQEEERLKFERKIKAEEEKLETQYQEVKNDPLIFPGVNGDYIHITENNNNKESFTLDQVKAFYENIKTLNPDVVNNIYFYGGTVPYVLTGATESRTFGDIDMFVPVKYMEKLREELSKESSFKILVDSKPYAIACMLSTRIPKEVTDIVTTNHQTNYIQNIYDGLLGIMTPNKKSKDYIDDKGFVHNEITDYKESSLPYYRKIQDFGFKAQLFGINISVFPIYEYENNIMAKSFKITTEEKYLLGVNIQNNTKIEDFMQQVDLNGQKINILPLEYTLISKQSAVNGNYAHRLEKDKQDIEYIINNAKRLGISKNKLEELGKNYPDYTISIAYGITEYNTINTLSGEEYKKRTLKKIDINAS